MREASVNVEVGEVSLATRVDGADGLPWIVLSNSLASTYDMWEGQIARLTQRFRVLRYDARGHGRSSAPNDPYSFNDLVGDVMGLIDHFGIEKADFLGLSLGGMTMLGIAINHPSRVNRIICCDARSDAIPPFIASWDARVAAIRAAGGMRGITEFAIERWFTPGCRQSRPEAVAKAEEMMLATDPEGYTACTAALKQLNYKPSLGKIAAPTLYVCGAQDQAAPSAVMREMAALTPGATYAEIDPGAHLCNIENPDAFNSIVGAWLDRAP